MPEEDSRSAVGFAPQDLILAARAGDQDARARLLEAYRNYLRLMARASIGSALEVRADASDLAQETLIKAHARFGQFRGSSERELVAWLRQILRRSLVDLVRRYKRSAGRSLGRERSLDASLQHSSQALERLLDAGGTTPSGAAQRRERGVLLADALSHLGEDHREVIVLRTLEEREWKDVGERMGRSADAVRMLWVRALERLRPLIEALT